MPNITCISEANLFDFLAGRTDEETSVRIETHVDDCETCQALIARVEDSSASQSGVPDHISDGRDPFESEPQCHQAVESLRNLSAADPIDAGAFPDEWKISEQLGPYQLLEPIGRGGMGAVYRAVHTKLKRDVAIKLLSPLRPPTQEQIARFEREMEAVGKLDHPNIVRASDAGEVDGMHYLVMELVEGMDVSRLTRCVDQVRTADACEIIRQAALGLQSAHQQGLVHRDIKPSNLMVTPAGDVKLLDMGLALLGEWDGDHDLTTVGQFMGTIEYMSPEQCDNCHDVDIRSDIYGLGATLYRLLTGQAPYPRDKYDSLFKRVAALASEEVPNPRSVRAGLPPELTEVVMRMLARDPSQRFDSPIEVAEALQPWCDKSDLPALLARASESSNDVAVTLPKPYAQQAQALYAADRAKPIQSKPMGSSGWRRPLLLTLLALGGFLALFGVFYVATDKGQLTIESYVPGVNVAIRRDAERIRDLKIDQTPYRTRLWSGHYVIDIIGDSSELMVEGGDIHLKRGEEKVVTIRRRRNTSNTEEPVHQPEVAPEEIARDTVPNMDNAAMPVGAAEEPQPQPDSIELLLDRLSFESTPANIAEILAQLRRKPIDGQGPQIAAAIFEVMQDYDTFDPTEDGEDVVVESIASMRILPFDQWQPLAIEQLRIGRPLSRLFAARMLHEFLFAESADELSDTVLAELKNAILRLSDETDPRQRAAAYGLAAGFTSRDQQLSELLGRKLVAEENTDACSVITQSLMNRGQHSEALVSALADQLECDPNPAYPFAPRDPGAAALNNLYQVPPEMLAGASDGLVKAFRQASLMYDPDEPAAETEEILFKSVQLLRKLGPEARDVVPDLQRFRNQNISNRLLREEATKAWHEIHNKKK